MSHFTVLVMAPELHNPDVLSAQLQPFHEYECTGFVDEHVKHHDRTEQYLQEFNTLTTQRIRLPDGRLIDPYTSDVDPFYRTATSEEVEKFHRGELRMRTRTRNGEPQVLELPEGAENIKVPVREVETIEDWLQSWHGCMPLIDEDLAAYEKDGTEPERSYYIVKDGKLVRATQFTNINAKWDWWVLGGRWCGSLKVKPGMEHLAQRGRPGLFHDESEDYDLVRKDALDLDAMKAEAMQQRREAWKSTYEKMLATEPDLTEEEADSIRFECLKTYDTLLDEWRKLDDKSDFPTWMKDRLDGRLATHFGTITDFFFSRVLDTGSYERIEDWIKAAPAISSYAMLIDGKWIGRGEMGWFGMSSGDEDAAVWEKKVCDAVEALPDHHYLAIVDCHI